MSMTDKPERIWIEQDDCPYFYEESELAEVGSPVTEYIRADLFHPTPAPCDELETEKWEAFIVGDWLQISGEHAAWKHSKVRELVTRQNAEEVIAAERVEKEKLEAAWLEAEGIISDLKADNKRLRATLKWIEMTAKDRSEKAWFRLEMIADEVSETLGEVKP